jgi:long-subunit fatty acid transport protein
LNVSEQGTDSQLGFNLGALYRSKRWSAGAAYRFGPKFHYEATTIIPTTFVPAAFVPGDGGAPFYSQFKGQIFDQKQATFKLPDTLALGFTVRPLETLVLSFEADRVWYSQLSDYNVEVFGIEAHGGSAGAANAADIRAGLVFPNVTQLRGGAEYVMVRSAGPNLAFRIGAWLDPDHRERFQGSDPRVKALFQPGTSSFHLSPGFGFSFDRFQIDTAFDVSARINTASVSTVFRF